MLHSMQLSKQKNIVFSVPNLETQADIKEIKKALSEKRVPGVNDVACDKINKTVTVYHNTERNEIEEFISTITHALEQAKFTANSVLSKSPELNEEAVPQVQSMQTTANKKAGKKSKF